MGIFDLGNLAKAAFTHAKQGIQNQIESHIRRKIMGEVKNRFRIGDLFGFGSKSNVSNSVSTSDTTGSNFDLKNLFGFKSDK